MSAPAPPPPPHSPPVPDPRTPAREGDRTAPEIPRDTLRLRGWRGRGGEPPDTRGDFVGDRPPTYEPEPTSLPLATAGTLADLVSDTVLDGAHYGTMTLRTASIRGDSARYRGEPRRDAVLTARFGAGDEALLLVAVATGARAAEQAHLAARDACLWIGGAVGRSHARLAEDIREGRRGSLKSGLHRLTGRSYGLMRAKAADLGSVAGEYTAALRCLLLPADPSCRTRVFFGTGPGGLFRLRDGAWQDLEPAAGDPTAPPGEAGEPTLPFVFRASVARPDDVLLLCSQGLAEPLRGQPALTDRLAERWHDGEPPGLAAFLADVQLRAKGYADDRTAAAVWES
ncbi:protein phosphatase 2C domain-containing protein [Streptomyces boninensis]|uniref:protein phosphatase 2C domain-containing protein n=1 Tax=Streptomyces boninensis TaxID=2039455 RepID=UPI003B21EC10